MIKFLNLSFVGRSHLLEPFSLCIHIKHRYTLMHTLNAHVAVNMLSVFSGVKHTLRIRPPTFSYPKFRKHNFY